MNALEITRKRVEAQGYLNLSDEELEEVSPWLRLAPAICMTWAAVATYFQSPIALAALIPIAAIGAIMKGHPFEIIYNHGIRHVIKTRHLPPAGKPRRFACGVATVWLIAASWAFYSGATLAGQILGYSLAVAAASPTFTDFCIPSFFYGLIFGKPMACPLTKG
jgi:hypothetical protein